MSAATPAFAIQIDELEGVVTFGLAVRMTIDALDLEPNDAQRERTRAALGALWNRLDVHVPPELVGVPIVLSRAEALAAAAAMTATYRALQRTGHAAALGIDPACLLAIRAALDGGIRAAHDVRASRLAALN